MMQIGRGENGSVGTIGRLGEWQDGKIGENQEIASKGQDLELTGEDAQAWRRRGRHDRNWQEVRIGRVPGREVEEARARPPISRDHRRARVLGEERKGREMAMASCKKGR
jgi:hypothetical protein